MTNPPPPPIRMTVDEIEKVITSRLFAHADKNGIYAGIDKSELLYELKEKLQDRITQGRFDLAIRNIIQRGEILSEEGLLRLGTNYYERLVAEDEPPPF